MTAIVHDNPARSSLDDAPSTARVVVIGGGMAGLAAAYRLSQHGSRHRVTLIERGPRLGGKVQTEQIDGFVLEAGPDSFLSAKPRGIGLATDLGIVDDLISPTPRRHRAFVLRSGRLHPLPEGLSGLVPSRLGPIFASGLLSPGGKLRFAADLLLPARSGEADESLASFVRRRLGPDAYDHLVEPLMAGIYAGDGERLSLAATFPQLRVIEREHGSLVRGVIAAKRSTPPGRQAARPAFVTTVGGLGDLVDALINRLIAAGVDLQMTRVATSVRLGKPGSEAPYVVELENGERITATAVVLATPAHVAGGLLGELDPELGGELRGIPHASTATIHLAFKRSRVAHPLDGHGYIIPRVEGRPALAATFVSEKWPDRAPAGYALLRVFLGRFGQEEVVSGADADLVAVARAEVAATLGITGEPVISHVQRWPWGMPQYVLGHVDRLRRIETAIARHPGLVLAGNAYRGVGIPDVVASGEAAAATVSEYLVEPTSVVAPPRPIC